MAKLLFKEKSLKVSPVDAEVHNKKGIGYAGKEDMKRAIEYFQVAV